MHHVARQTDSLSLPGVSVSLTVGITIGLPTTSLDPSTSASNTTSSTPTETTSSSSATSSSSSSLTMSNSTSSGDPTSPFPSSDPSTTTPPPTFMPTSSVAQNFTTITTSVNGQLLTFTSPLPTSLIGSQKSSNTSQRTSVIAGATAAGIIVLLGMLGAVFAFRRHRLRRQTEEDSKRKEVRRLLDGEDFDDDIAPPMRAYTRYSEPYPQPSPLLSSSSPGILKARTSESGSIFRDEVWPPSGSSFGDPLLKRISQVDFASIIDDVMGPSPSGSTTDVAVAGHLRVINTSTPDSQHRPNPSLDSTTSSVYDYTSPALPLHHTRSNSQSTPKPRRESSDANATRHLSVARFEPSRFSTMSDAPLLSSVSLYSTPEDPLQPPAPIHSRTSSLEQPRLSFDRSPSPTYFDPFSGSPGTTSVYFNPELSSSTPLTPPTQAASLPPGASPPVTPGLTTSGRTSRDLRTPSPIPPLPSSQSSSTSLSSLPQRSPSSSPNRLRKHRPNNPSVTSFTSSVKSAASSIASTCDSTATVTPASILKNKASVAATNASPQPKKPSPLARALSDDTRIWLGRRPAHKGQEGTLEGGHAGERESMTAANSPSVLELSAVDARGEKPTGSVS